MKPTLIDSHAHLSMADFDKDRSQVIHRAFEEGIQAILCPVEFTNSAELQIGMHLNESHKNILTAIGIHPHNAKHFTQDSIEKIEELAKSENICAIGEIGLDFHYNFSSPQKQIDVFRQQLNLAKNLRLPVIVHSRQAAKEIATAINEEHFTRGGILHCFTEDWEFAKQMMEKSFLISFSGIITFPKAHSLRDVARKIPDKKLLIETDSPYIVPAPYRSRVKRNEPAYVKETAKFLAGLRNTPFESLATVTTENFKSLFKLELGASLFP